MCMYTSVYKKEYVCEMNDTQYFRCVCIIICMVGCGITEHQETWQNHTKWLATQNYAQV